MNSETATISIPDGTLQCVTIRYDIHRDRYRLDWKFDTPVLSVPRGTTRSEIESILHRHRRWIGRRKSERERAGKTVADTPSDISIPFAGNIFHPERSGDNIRAVTADFKRRKILVPTEIGEPSSSEAIRLWILEQFVRQITGSLDIWFEQTGFHPARIHIRATRSQWGSMSASGNLSLSWYLFPNSPRTLHYIVLHELVHLRYRNHSQAFWNKVESHDPEYRNARKELKTPIGCPAWLSDLPGGKAQIRIPWEPARGRKKVSGPVEDSERIVLL